MIGCAATLQTAGGLNLMMQVAERLLRRHPSTSPCWRRSPPGPSPSCAAPARGHTMFPIIADIALQKNIRPERPMAVGVRRPQMAICASPVSVAVVSMVSILAAATAWVRAYGLLDILMIAIPLPLTRCHDGGPWSLRAAGDLDKDEEFQANLRTPPSGLHLRRRRDPAQYQVPERGLIGPPGSFRRHRRRGAAGCRRGCPVFAIKEKTGPSP